jgi:hypothetical protein
LLNLKQQPLANKTSSLVLSWSCQPQNKTSYNARVSDTGR